MHRMGCALDRGIGDVGHVLSGAGRVGTAAVRALLARTRGRRLAMTEVGVWRELFGGPDAGATSRRSQHRSQELRYSAPRSMGGRGNGTSPRGALFPPSASLLCRHALPSARPARAPGRPGHGSVPRQRPATIPRGALHSSSHGASDVPAAPTRVGKPSTEECARTAPPPLLHRQSPPVRHPLRGW